MTSVQAHTDNVEGRVGQARNVVLLGSSVSLKSTMNITLNVFLGTSQTVFAIWGMKWRVQVIQV